jgi:hypothetical protein
MVVADGCPVEYVHSFRYLGLTVHRCKGFGAALAAIASAAMHAAYGQGAGQGGQSNLVEGELV